MRYVDGYVLPIPAKNLKAYRRIAKKAGQIWRKHGALEYYECKADDLHVMEGILSFEKLLNLKKGETAVFAYVVYKSRKHRDRVNAKVMADPFMNDPKNASMPFDMKRMAYGGFAAIVEA